MEDNEVDVRYLRHVLSKAGITTISHARDGEQAVMQLRALAQKSAEELAASPIVMLLDLNMPILNGFDVLQFVQDEPILSAVKIFVVTSHDDARSRARAAEAGVTGYIVKPLSLGQVADILETLKRPTRHISKPLTSSASEWQQTP
ncbi:MAG TPA: response regulator [Opitutaceae bacterium]|nr:response regulator [Opitutaceae bacterium]